MTVKSTQLAASIAAVADNIACAMRTYERCPLGGKVREDLVISVQAQAERLGHLLYQLDHEDEGDRIRQHEEECHDD